MSWILRLLPVTVILLSTGCSYGPEHTDLRLDSVVAKPRSHELAVSLGYARVRDPTGFFNTFPNGGIPEIVSREARIYRCDLDRGTADLVAAIPDFGGIPQAKSVFIHGWRGEALYFSLFGYGGNARTGDDHSDKRRLFYRVTAEGQLEEVEQLPPGLEQGRNSGPVDSPPFLRWSRGHLEVDIAIDARISEATNVTRLTFDPESGEPHLSRP